MLDRETLSRNSARVCATRKRMDLGLKALGLETIKIESFFIFTRLGSAEEAAGAYRFLKERNILVRYFPARLLDDGLRISVGNDEEIAALLVALAQFKGMKR